MTKAERALGETLRDVGFVAAIGFFFGFMLAGIVILFGTVASSIAKYRGVTYHPHPALREGFWSLGLGLGFSFATMLIIAVVFVQFKSGNWRKLVLPAFIWPEASSPTPSMLARVGRVLHWLFVVVAALSLALGVFAVYEAYQSEDRSRQEVAAWDKSHADPQHPGQIVTYAPNQYGYNDYRPTVYPVDYTGLWVGIACGFVALLLGRGLRYILAAE